MANPARIRILALIAGHAMTAAELAEEVGLRPSTVEYHLRRLASAGMLEVAGGEGDERRYRRIPQSPRWEIEEDRERALALRALASDLHRRWSSEHVGELKVVYDGELWVDAQTWGRVCEQVMSALQRLRAAAREPRAEGTVHVSATATFFPMLDERDRPPPLIAPSLE
jgi:DNA-binding transcriptional ArsR family regulator